MSTAGVAASRRRRTTTPRVSVITVCYNARTLIEHTLASVKDQHYQNIEIVVIDGASTDGTYEVLREASSDIDVLISEPDKGVYDAMNKGLSEASGEWVIFLNAGDSFVSPTVISEVAQFLNSDCALVYGGVVLHDGSGARNMIFQRPIDWGVVKNICHQVIFYNRTKLRELFTFNTAYRICADFDLLVRVLERFGASACRRIDTPIANYLLGGISDKQRNRRIRERLVILRRSQLPVVTKILSLANALRHYMSNA